MKELLERFGGTIEYAYVFEKGKWSAYKTNHNLEIFPTAIPRKSRYF